MSPESTFDLPPETTPLPPTKSESSDPRKFYVVWSPQGGPPVPRMASVSTARTAAARLSHRFPHKGFFVLASCWGKLGTPAAMDEVEVPETEVTP